MNKIDFYTKEAHGGQCWHEKSQKPIDETVETATTPPFFEVAVTPLDQCRSALERLRVIDKRGMVSHEINQTIIPNKQVRKATTELLLTLMPWKSGEITVVEFLLIELQAAEKLKQPLPTFKIVGSQASYLLVEMLPEIFKSRFGEEAASHLLKPAVMQRLRRKPSDIDTRSVSHGQLGELHERINEMAGRSLEMRGPDPSPFKECLDFFERGYILVKLGDTIDHCVSTTTVHGELQRSFLFTANDLELDVTFELLKPVEELLSSFDRVKSLESNGLRIDIAVSGFYKMPLQSLIDKGLGILRESYPIEKERTPRKLPALDYRGALAWLSALVRGGLPRVSGEFTGLLETFLKKYPLQQEGYKSAYLSQDPIEGWVKRLSNHLTHIVESHHRGDRHALLPLLLTFELLVAGREHLPFQKLWERVFCGDDAVDAMVLLRQRYKLSGQELGALLQVAALMALSLPGKRQRGSYFVELVSMGGEAGVRCAIGATGNEENISYIVIPLDLEGLEKGLGHPCHLDSGERELIFDVMELLFNPSSLLKESSQQSSLVGRYPLTIDGDKLLVYAERCISGKEPVYKAIGLSLMVTLIAVGNKRAEEMLLYRFLPELIGSEGRVRRWALAAAEAILCHRSVGSRQQAIAEAIGSSGPLTWLHALTTTGDPELCYHAATHSLLLCRDGESLIAKDAWMTAYNGARSCQKLDRGILKQLLEKSALLLKAGLKIDEEPFLWLSAQVRRHLAEENPQLLQQWIERDHEKAIAPFIEARISLPKDGGKERRELRRCLNRLLDKLLSHTPIKSQIIKQLLRDEEQRRLLGNQRWSIYMGRWLKSDGGSAADILTLLLTKDVPLSTSTMLACCRHLSLCSENRLLKVSQNSIASIINRLEVSHRHHRDALRQLLLWIRRGGEVGLSDAMVEKFFTTARYSSEESQEADVVAGLEYLYSKGLCPAVFTKEKRIADSLAFMRRLWPHPRQRERALIWVNLLKKLLQQGAGSLNIEELFEVCYRLRDGGKIAILWEWLQLIPRPMTKEKEAVWRSLAYVAAEEALKADLSVAVEIAIDSSLAMWDSPQSERYLSHLPAFADFLLSNKRSAIPLLTLWASLITNQGWGELWKLYFSSKSKACYIEELDRLTPPDVDDVTDCYRLITLAEVRSDQLSRYIQEKERTIALLSTVSTVDVQRRIAACQQLLTLAIGDMRHSHDTLQAFYEMMVQLHGKKRPWSVYLTLVQAALKHERWPLALTLSHLFYADSEKARADDRHSVAKAWLQMIPQTVHEIDRVAIADFYFKHLQQQTISLKREFTTLKKQELVTKIQELINYFNVVLESGLIHTTDPLVSKNLWDRYSSSLLETSWLSMVVMESSLSDKEHLPSFKVMESFCQPIYQMMVKQPFITSREQRQCCYIDFLKNLDSQKLIYQECVKWFTCKELKEFGLFSNFDELLLKLPLTLHPFVIEVEFTVISRSPEEKLKEASQKLADFIHLLKEKNKNIPLLKAKGPYVISVLALLRQQFHSKDKSEKLVKTLEYLYSYFNKQICAISSNSRDSGELQPLASEWLSQIEREERRRFEESAIIMTRLSSTTCWDDFSTIIGVAINFQEKLYGEREAPIIPMYELFLDRYEWLVKELQGARYHDLMDLIYNRKQSKEVDSCLLPKNQEASALMRRTTQIIQSNVDKQVERVLQEQMTDPEELVMHAAAGLLAFSLAYDLKAYVDHGDEAVEQLKKIASTLHYYFISQADPSIKQKHASSILGIIHTSLGEALEQYMFEPWLVELLSHALGGECS